MREAEVAAAAAFYGDLTMGERCPFNVRQVLSTGLDQLAGRVTPIAHTACICLETPSRLPRRAVR